MKRFTKSFAFTSLLALGVLSACAPAGGIPSATSNSVIDEAGQEPQPSNSPEVQQLVQQKADEIAQLGFQEPMYTMSSGNKVLGAFSYVDPGHVVPDALLKQAVLYYNANLSKIKNKTYLSVVDFSKYSGETRFYVINMNTGIVWPIHVAHGSGSDPKFSGYATKFSNTSGSDASSLGYYLTAEIYSGKHGRSLRLDGLSSTNSNVRKRDVVIHGASYVYEADKKAGRSWGCLAVAMSNRDKVVSELQGGSLIYAGLSN